MIWLAVWFYLSHVLAGFMIVSMRRPLWAGDMLPALLSPIILPFIALRVSLKRWTH